ncbi:polysaccharide lyase family 4 protein [Auriculariales sp. MPI-PUGE-AT-0066]|nr:polysaccharide lyase family 4 protein [Auriculariales sp. MPI-PUGE-AT-0066]
MKCARTHLALWCALAITSVSAANGPFLQTVDTQTWIIGNEVWNMTQKGTYGSPLWFQQRNCVGAAKGHYLSASGSGANFTWTSASIVANSTYNNVPFMDISFTSPSGDMHWVIFSNQQGAYQYFVNRAVPPGEFRSLWRLDNSTFTRGHTATRDAELPPLSSYLAENKVQDETWLTPDGSGYITKYDFTSWIRAQRYYGVYGTGFGSWYINPGKDYYNGNHLKQELTVHRESATGDVVQLNMIHGTHFELAVPDAAFTPASAKMWGPWLWYINNGSLDDAAAKAEAEFAAWPYKWMQDDAYNARGSVSGKLVLSDGRSAANAAVFLGDSNPTVSSLDQGIAYHYTAYADIDGVFTISSVRAGKYSLEAWSNGSTIADVNTRLLVNNFTVNAGQTTTLGNLAWAVSNKTRLFRVGDFDRTSVGFAHGAAPWQHALVDQCPTTVDFVVGQSKTSDWCFGQTYLGNWTVNFDIASNATASSKNATLIVSLAGYSTGASSNIWANGVQIGNLTSGTSQLLNDPSVYRSGTAAGEWRYFEFSFGSDVLKAGQRNSVVFELNKNASWKGFMWDAVALEW